MKRSPVRRPAPKNPSSLLRCTKACVALCLLFTLAGCSEKPAASFTTQINPTVSTNPPAPLLFDDFESPKLAEFWLPADYGSGRYAPGAVKISTNYARTGKQSVEVTVHEGDIEQAGDDDTKVERADLDSGHFPLLDQEAWYAFSFLIPKDFPVVDTRLVIGSCKQTDVSRPIMAQRYRNGKHTLTVESHGKKEDYKLPSFNQGEWVDMLYRLRYSTGKDGLVEVWMNGKLVAAYSGPTAEQGFRNAFYHKIGLYRDRMKPPMTIYFDNYIMGPSRPSISRQ